MPSLFKRAYRFILARMGYDMLGDEFRRFMWVQLCMTASGTIAGSYFGIFLLRATGSDVTLMVYNLLLALVQPFVMVVAVRTVRRFSVLSSQRVAFVLLLIAYLLLTIMTDRIEKIVYPISILLSSSNAFFWTSYPPMILSYTNDQNRDAANGAIGFLSTLLSLVIPVTSGFFISSFGDLTGYRALYALSSGICVLTIVLSFRLAPLGLSRERHTQFRKTMHYILKNKPMLAAMLNTAINAVAATAPGYFGTLIVMELISRESYMGMISLVCGVVGLFSSAAYGMLVKPRTRARWMALAIAILISSVGGMILERSIATYVLYCAVGAAVGIFINTPPLTSYLAVLQRIPELGENGSEVHTIREVFYGGGRVIGLIPVFFFQDAREMAAVIIFAIYALQGLSALLTGYIYRHTGGEHARAF